MPDEREGEQVGTCRAELIESKSGPAVELPPLRLRLSTSCQSYCSPSDKTAVFDDHPIRNLVSRNRAIHPQLDVLKARRPIANLSSEMDSVVANIFKPDVLALASPRIEPRFDREEGLS